MKSWQAVCLAGLLVPTGAVAQATPACAVDVLNEVSCTIEVAVFRISRFGAERCIIFLRNLLDDFWVGFKKQPTEITWKITRTNPAGTAIKFTGVEFEDPSAFSLVSGVGTDAITYKITNTAAFKDHKYTLKMSGGAVSCQLDPWVRIQ